jgi:hypothetical protein
MSLVATIPTVGILASGVVAAKPTHQQSMEMPMSNEAKVIFDPKLNFELPKEIGPLLEQTVSVSIAEGFDACFEFSFYAEYSRKL